MPVRKSNIIGSYISVDRKKVEVFQRFFSSFNKVRGSEEMNDECAKLKSFRLSKAEMFDK